MVPALNIDEMLRDLFDLCDSILGISDFSLICIVQICCKSRQFVDNQRQLLFFLVAISTLVTAIIVIGFFANEKHKAHNFSVSLSLSNIERSGRK
jgi:hypothetical protein